jgi:hypothetical protein
LEQLELGEVGDIEAENLLTVKSCVCVDGVSIVVVIAMVAVMGRREGMLLLLEGIDGLRVCDTEDGAGQGHCGRCPGSAHSVSCLLGEVFVGTAREGGRERRERGKEGRKKERKEEGRK